MIFVTVGTGDRGFDRLIRAVDRNSSEINEPIRAQIGRGEYTPINIDWFRFTSEEEIHTLYRTASVVVAHAGAGTLLTALSYQKPIVVLPRREKFKEHNDDHQMQLANALQGRPDVFVILNTDQLKSAIKDAQSASGGGATQNDSLDRFLSEYLSDIEP